jgi:hypothetical protein
MKCKLSSTVIFLIVFGWLGAIILLSLLFGTTGLKETFYPSSLSIASYKDDGVEEAIPSDLNMALLSENKASVSCCESTYSSSNGCLCLTKDQLEDIKTRGGNKT